MSLDTRPPRQSPVRQVATPRERDEARGLPSRSLLLALVLACVALMVVDLGSGEDSPVAPARRLVGEVLGPAEAGVSEVLGPLVALPGNLHTNDALREENAELEARIDALEQEDRKAGYEENRLEAWAGLAEMANGTGYTLAPARVISYGSAQSFSSTVTISAGTDAGLRPDMTVLNADGLVGRIIEVTSQTATVLLVVDAGSTVGGRVGDNMENGMVEGRGGLEDDEPLELRLLDNTVVPEKGQAVVTWGSEGGAPYVSGVPIGEVDKVFEELRLGTYRAVLEPYVDFTKLDLVGVVVPAGGDGVIEPGAFE
ncbi:rod shape-determining protein MreC [Nocardioides bizhenqiangii]|uniref:Cell shape-determining protein MreC n=1 Tax=Nocardioides bizhenqiangii TaxID=3095076 RepID=A0ABZ0ZMI1_9ACTN|nr:rod shape-determining protein MreC [Nocardioides sp. HM61]WQQ25447.1 rod shape-determining protein MreC [Nocardioides sp. HM61]